MTATPRFEYVTRARSLVGASDTIVAQHLDERDRELELWLEQLLQPQVITTGATAGTGWSLTLFEAIIHPIGIAHVRIRATRTGALITPPADGNLSPAEVLATLPASLTPAGDTVLTNDHFGRVCGGALVASTLAVTLGSVGVASEDIDVAELVSLGGTVILA